MNRLNFVITGLEKMNIPNFVITGLEILWKLPEQRQKELTSIGKLLLHHQEGDLSPEKLELIKKYEVLVEEIKKLKAPDS